ncbi:MAG: hypothetical protein WCN98_08295 [Verrucomicrobiaceae bacterium]
MDPTTINTYVTIGGIIITVASVWFTWYLGRRRLRTDRINEVMTRYVNYHFAANPPSKAESPAGVFMKSGAFTLSQDEYEECVAKIVESGFPDPSDLFFKNVDSIKRAKEMGLNLNKSGDRFRLFVEEWKKNN